MSLFGKSKQEVDPGLPETAEPYYTGEVKFFKPKAGYGFIIPDVPDALPSEGRSAEGDIFVGQWEIAVHGFRSLNSGNRVRFELGEDEDGRLYAKDVEILSTLSDE